MKRRAADAVLAVEEVRIAGGGGAADDEIDRAIFEEGSFLDMPEIDILETAVGVDGELLHVFVAVAAIVAAEVFCEKARHGDVADAVRLASGKSEARRKNGEKAQEHRENAPDDSMHEKAPSPSLRHSCRVALNGFCPYFTVL